MLNISLNATDISLYKTAITSVQLFKHENIPKFNFIYVLLTWSLKNGKRSSLHTNTESIHTDTHLQVPTVTALTSHSAARTWIRSVSYPVQSGIPVVHFDNESEPLIKVQAVIKKCAEWFARLL